MSRTLLGLVVTVFFVASLSAQEKPAKAAKKAEISDAAYTAQAMQAAPRSIAKDAGVIRMGDDGNMRTLRESKNGFTCMMIAANKMCSDANSMAFFEALMKDEPPTEKLGISYMLAGDKGASNTNPKAEKKTADNHWVVTGPHLMITGTQVKSLGLPDSADADPTKPYLMWASTPYAHAMIPVGGEAKPAAQKPASEKQ
jgi:hypothetical protein